MPVAHLTRVVTFSAAHRYHRPDWTDEQNRDAFGLCANPHGHGHNYRCGVTITGPVPAETAMVIDLAAFDALLNEVVVRPFDHTHINHAIPEFAFGKTVPTAEALCVYFWNRIAERLPSHVTLARIRIEEDDTLYAEYQGE